MLLTLVLLSFVALHSVTSEESSSDIKKSPAGKSIGNGYGYSRGSYGRGSSYGYTSGNQINDDYGDYEHGSSTGHGNYEHGSSTGHGNYEHGSSSDYGQGYSTGGSYRPNRGRKEKLAPIQIPYIDRNGCRFPGDVVCDPEVADPPITYGYCILSDENKNLWKKPSMEIIAADCVPEGTQILTDFCNDNERLLKAAGLIKDKDIHTRYYHQLKYSVSLNPCILVLPP